MQPNKGIWSWLRGFRPQSQPVAPEAPTNCTHVVLLDGTMSTLSPGCETNVGLTYRLLCDLPADAAVRVHYEPGIQWRGITRAHEVMAGIGINRQIRRAYTFLAEGYKPGDRVVLIGYSRGAYAVRSLAGLVDRLGLLQADQVTQARVEALYTLYREAPNSQAARIFSATHCHPEVPIAFLGVYDTVRALGIRWPLLWRFLPLPHPYHTHTLGRSIRVARQALALQETRMAYEPILWDTDGTAAVADVQQVWFQGAHGDIGGQVTHLKAARPRSNIALHWMLAEAEGAGLRLPAGWHARFETDPGAPSVGSLRGFGKLFWARRRRKVGRDPSERLHPTAHLGGADIDHLPVPPLEPTPPFGAHS